MRENSHIKSQVNELHLRIGNILEEVLKERKDVVLLKDKACGGLQRIPLFFTSDKSRETEYCNVDLMILKNNKIKVIIEIEKSNVKPTQLCGKFLTSALTKFYIHKSTNDSPIRMDSSVAFIQIVDSSKLDSKTKKFDQWDNLQKSIEAILPIGKSTIKKYLLLQGSLSDFEVESNINNLVSNVQAALI